MPMMCGASTVETGPKNKGGELLEPPILTTPQRFNAWSPPGSGVRLEGTKKSTIQGRPISWVGLYICSEVTIRFYVPIIERINDCLKMLL